MSEEKYCSNHIEYFGEPFLVFSLFSSIFAQNSPAIPILMQFGYWDHHRFAWLPQHPIYEAVKDMLLDNPSSSKKSSGFILRSGWEISIKLVRIGPRYLSGAFYEIGFKFPYREIQAALNVCPVSTRSSPLDA